MQQIRTACNKYLKEALIPPEILKKLLMISGWVEVDCCANQLTGFYMRVTLALHGLIRLIFLDIRSEIWR